MTFLLVGASVLSSTLLSNSLGRDKELEMQGPRPHCRRTEVSLTQMKRHREGWESCGTPGTGQRGCRELGLSNRQRMARTMGSTVVSEWCSQEPDWTGRTLVTTIPGPRAGQPLNRRDQPHRVTQPPLYLECHRERRAQGGFWKTKQLWKADQVTQEGWHQNNFD